MGLAIDGNEVHGIARGGQAFVSIGNVNSTDGSLNIDGQDYLSKNKMGIKDTGEFSIEFSNPAFSGGIVDPTIDVTNELSNYEGYLAICVIQTGIEVLSKDHTTSLPIIIPTAPTTNGLALSFDLAGWSGLLSRTTNNKFTFVPHYTNADTSTSASSYFYILSNN